MTISMVEVITDRNETLQFSLEDTSNGYEVRDITGLDPVKAEITASSFGTVDGTQYQASRREQRNIVLKLGYAPNFLDQTVSSLRRALYNKFMPKDPVRLKFYLNDGLVVQIAGRVESFEAPLFVKDPDATLSMLFFNPDFKNIVGTLVNGFTTNSSVEQTIMYEGNIDVGFVFKLLVNRSITDMVLQLRDPGNNISAITFKGNLIASDILEISTVPGAKGVWLNRGTTRTSILYNVDPISVYRQFTPGENRIRAYVAGASIPYQITYVSLYGGL